MSTALHKYAHSYMPALGTANPVIAATTATAVHMRT
jgi:hypothetical protein